MMLTDVGCNMIDFYFLYYQVERLVSATLMGTVSVSTISMGFQVGFQAIAEALGLAAVKAVVAISAIIAGGRLVSILFFQAFLDILYSLLWS